MLRKERGRALSEAPLILGMLWCDSDFPGGVIENEIFIRSSSTETSSANKIQIQSPLPVHSHGGQRGICRIVVVDGARIMTSASPQQQHQQHQQHQQQQRQQRHRPRSVWKPFTEGSSSSSSSRHQPSTLHVVLDTTAPTTSAHPQQQPSKAPKAPKRSGAALDPSAASKKDAPKTVNDTNKEPTAPPPREDSPVIESTPKKDIAPSTKDAPTTTLKRESPHRDPPRPLTPKESLLQTDQQSFSTRVKSDRKTMPPPARGQKQQQQHQR